jgi:hypothetical protein
MFTAITINNFCQRGMSMSFALVIVAACACLLSIDVNAGFGATAQLPPSTLTIIDTAANLSIPVDQRGEADFSFGPCYESRTQQLQHAFQLKNANQTPIIIAQIQPTCGCTSVVLGEHNDLPITLQPGESIELRISIDVSHLPEGAFSKQIFINAPHQPAPLAILTLTGELKSGVSFNATAINFGRTIYGESPTQPVTITVDPELAVKTKDLKIVSSTSDVTVKQSIATTGQASNIARFDITLSPHAHLGRFVTSLSLIVPTEASAITKIGKPIEVIGEVVGSFSASPQSVSLNGTTDKLPAPQEVLLTGVSPADTGSYKVESNVPYVVATFAEPASNSTSSLKVARLQISLTNQAPTGINQALVIVTAPDGETLNIPVFIQFLKTTK